MCILVAKVQRDYYDRFEQVERRVNWLFLAVSRMLAA